MNDPMMQSAPLPAGPPPPDALMGEMGMPPMDPAMMDPAAAAMGAPMPMGPQPGALEASLDPNNLAMIAQEAMRAARDAAHAELDMMQDEAEQAAMQLPMTQAVMAGPVDAARGMAAGPPMPAELPVGPPPPEALGMM